MKMHYVAQYANLIVNERATVLRYMRWCRIAMALAGLLSCWAAVAAHPAPRMTASALMILVDEGKVHLDDPVEHYLPAFKGMKVAVAPAPAAVQMETTGGVLCGTRHGYAVVLMVQRADDWPSTDRDRLMARMRQVIESRFANEITSN